MLLFLFQCCHYKRFSFNHIGAKNLPVGPLRIPVMQLYIISFWVLLKIIKHRQSSGLVRFCLRFRFVMLVSKFNIKITFIAKMSFCDVIIVILVARMLNQKIYLIAT